MSDLGKSLESILSSTLLQTLRGNKSLTLDKGIDAVIKAAQGTGLFTNDAEIAAALQKVKGMIRHHGVLNPNWLTDEKEMGVYFYFVNAQPGWLGPLVEQAKSLVGCSYYILYGTWDLLIVLHGSKVKAGQLQQIINESQSYELAYFSAARIPLFYGCATWDSLGKWPKTLDVSAHDINLLVDNCDHPDFQDQRLQLEESKILLGSRWEINTPAQRDPKLHPGSGSDVSAIVGIRLGRGYRAPSPDEVLKALQSKDEVLASSLVHLVETDSGYPFNYVAKVACGSRDELDQITDAIAFCRVGSVPLEGNTSIIARGRQVFPTLEAERVIDSGLTPDLSQVGDAARKMLIGLGSEATAAFNNLPPTTKLVVLRSLDELTQQIQNQNWDEATHARLQFAYSAFARASIEGAKQGSLVGSVMLLAPAVEETVQTTMRLIIEAVYDKDFRRAQNELKLPTKIISKLSLGKAVMAFRTMKGHSDFGFMADSLDDAWLKRMERFAEVRNTWAHTGGAVEKAPDAVIDEARRILVEGIELIRWIWTEVLAAYEEHRESMPPPDPTDIKVSAGDGEPKVPSKPEKEIRLKPSGDREIFLSHSSKDAKIAEQIAKGLKALGYPVWYADWAIAPGQSIVEKINEALARNDTLIVLLSENSVKSKWVERELNTALMSQLSGQDVAVIPILIEDCEIPETLRAVRYIDMRADGFQKGFIQLLEFFQARLRG